MIEFFLGAEGARRGFVAHLDEIANRKISERVGVFFAAFEIFRKGAFAVIGKFFKALVQHDAIFKRRVHSLTVERYHRMRRVAEQANFVPVIPRRAANGHE